MFGVYFGAAPIELSDCDPNWRMIMSVQDEVKSVWRRTLDIRWYREGKNSYVLQQKWERDVFVQRDLFTRQIDIEEEWRAVPIVVAL